MKMIEKTYDGMMDKECIELCNIINSLPGLETTESCCGHGKGPYMIFFKVKISKVGLFVLTRSIDKRYWEFGHIWNISLYVGDCFINKRLPIKYILSSNKSVGEKAYKEANSLVQNIKDHIAHENFRKYYKLKL